jgi:methylenetetrahydrofolate dehydrogenase (NADP+)/methenyltetrahydrofolate cyclohydrolase
MTGQVIDGRKIAGDLKADVASEARNLKAAGVTAGIATVLIGGDAASRAYSRQAAVESVDEWASHSGKLGLHTRRADVLIVAAGVPGLIRGEHVREGAVVLDVGINQVADLVTGAGRLAGDVDFDAVAPRVRAITPVPGGIGPVTDVWVIRNTTVAARNAARPRAA